MKKRLLAITLALVMMLSLLPAAAFAATVTDSGTCGSNVTWMLDSDGVLTISGKGKMTDYSSDDDFYAPWFKYAYSGPIRSVVVKNGVTHIGNDSFLQFYSIYSVTLADSVESIGDYAFYSCGNIKDLTLGKGLKSIGYCSFYSCSNITEIDFPDKLGSIGEGAFNSCEKLSAVNIPSSVKEIGSGAFSTSRGIKKVTVGDGATNIGKSAFSMCSGIEELVIGNGAVTVGEQAFAGCEKLLTVTIGSGAVTIGEKAFLRCESLKSFTVGGGIKSIGDSAFYNCDTLTTVKIGSSNSGRSETDIAREAFYGCKGLTSLDLGSTKSIGDFAFAFCSNLRELTLPDGVERIGEMAFEYCGITSLTVPASVKELGEYAFSSCAQLSSVTFEGSAYPGFDRWLFLSTADDLTLYLPAGDSSWTSSEYYDPANQTWGRYPVIFFGESSHTHSYTARVTAPTCTAQGYTTYTCSCGDSYKGDYTPALGHSYANGVCTRCGAADPSYKPNDPTIKLTDIDGLIDSFKESILWAVGKGITTGYEDNTFRPNNTCTRGHVVTFLWRAAGSPQPKSTVNRFTDVAESSPFYKAILWAAEQGITTGYADGTFRPNDACTRAHVVTFLWRFEGKPDAVSLVSLVDLIGLNADFSAAIKWAASKGITTGYADGTFRPNAVCTRAHVVTFLYRDIGSEAEFSVGNVNDNTYKNAYFGIGCTLDETWIFLSQEEINELESREAMGDAYYEYVKENIDNGTAFTDMEAYNLFTAKKVYVTIQKLNWRGVTSEEMIDGSLQNRDYKKEYQLLGATDVSVKKSYISFLGERCPCIQIDYKNEGNSECSQDVIVIAGYYAFIASSVANSPSEATSILQSFYRYS